MARRTAAASALPPASPAHTGTRLRMLQAVLALEHFLNRPLDRGAMAAAASAALEHKQLF